MSAERIPLLDEARAALCARRRNSPVPALWQALDAVKDPELPVLSLWDLGILQDIRSTKEGTVVSITPTYSGCPATEIMRDDVVACLRDHGVDNVRVELKLSPAWSSDWMTADAKAALRQYGVAPPGRTDAPDTPVRCPQCNSADTERVSEFGSTACKALYRCRACVEPFDYFKPL